MSSTLVTSSSCGDFHGRSTCWRSWAPSTSAPSHFACWPTWASPTFCAGRRTFAAATARGPWSRVRHLASADPWPLSSLAGGSTSSSSAATLTSSGTSRTPSPRLTPACRPRRSCLTSPSSPRLKVPGEEAMRRLREAVDGLDVGVLVNNAGVAKPCAVYLHEFDVDAWARMIRVNLWALTEVTAAVLPGMLARRRGAIVNIGSGSTEVIPSFPLYTIYAATKRYVSQFSRSLYVEYRSKGIDIQCQVT